MNFCELFWDDFPPPLKLWWCSFLWEGALDDAPIEVERSNLGRGLRLTVHAVEA